MQQWSNNSPMKNTCILFCLVVLMPFGCSESNTRMSTGRTRSFNGEYTGENLNRISFPIGGLGAGMICLDGNGAFSSVSVRNKPDVFNNPFMFAAFTVKGYKNASKILEGPVQNWKIYGSPGSANGSELLGCPRFETASFSARFPFGTVHLADPDMPVQVGITGWSPFIPTDADKSGLPAGVLEYTFTNTTREELSTVFSFHAENFMRVENPSEWGGDFVGGDTIMAMENGFVLEQSCLPDKPQYKGSFAIYTDAPGAVTDYCWFRGGWFDSRTILWKNIETGSTPDNPASAGSPGASIYIPLILGPKESKTVRVFMAWYVPHSDLRIGSGPGDKAMDVLLAKAKCTPGSSCCSPEITAAFYEPWYSGRFRDVREVAQFWKTNYEALRRETMLFTDAFYSSDLPPEVLEAVSANLGILKSPTVLRQKNGSLWAWEGCHDKSGCCNGSCTHVWNYAQAVPHLFPKLERTLRETEFLVNQGPNGHQTFRANLPIRRTANDWYAAADGQLGGIMKVYRDWRISGDSGWLKKLWPSVRQSMDFCIAQWDPRHTGTIEEPHHNTYDIEFWGPEALCTGFYLGALTAAIKLSEAIGEDISLYRELLENGRKQMETGLYNGEYFMQNVKWKGLSAPSPVDMARQSLNISYSPEALDILEKEGPKYQYGDGCLSDGVLGEWIARMCGMGNVIDDAKVQSHLLAVYKYNLKTDLSDHVNPQRASYAFGNEGGLILCSWPRGGQPVLPFVYSNEVWTGIEYQVASHLMLTGHVKEGLEIVRVCRARYDGRVRNPFDEYECGHWYARAMSSYGLIQGLTGLQYDAVTRTLIIDSKIGIDFRCFIATETGFGMAGLRRGKPFIDVRYGTVDVKSALVSGQVMELAH
jgi:uncharacterized protein (DUF608 family)